MKTFAREGSLEAPERYVISRFGDDNLDYSNTIVPRFDRIVLVSPRRMYQPHGAFAIARMVSFLYQGYLGLVSPPSKPYRCPYKNRLRVDLVTDTARIAVYGSSHYTLWSVMIVDRRKVRPDDYHLDVDTVSTLLEMFLERSPILGPFHVSLAEIALDVLNEKLARKVVKTIFHPWIKISKTFNYSRGAFKLGGSSKGFDQYHYYRQDARQFHDYEKAEGLYRFEIILRRRYLRPHRVNSVDQLFERAPELLQRNLRFIKLNRKKLITEFPRARGWELHKMQPIAQIAKIQRHITRLTGRNYTVQDIRRKYYVPAESPQMLLSMFDLDSRKCRDILSVNAAYPNTLTKR